MTDTNTLMKLEYLLATLEGEARHFNHAWELSGTAAIRRQGMALAYDEAAKALIDLIDDLKGVPHP
jgi:hypothetical protein